MTSTTTNTEPTAAAVQPPDLAEVVARYRLTDVEVRHLQAQYDSLRGGGSESLRARKSVQLAEALDRLRQAHAEATGWGSRELGRALHRERSVGTRIRHRMDSTDPDDLGDGPDGLSECLAEAVALRIEIQARVRACAVRDLPRQQAVEFATSPLPVPPVGTRRVVDMTGRPFGLEARVQGRGGGPVGTVVDTSPPVLVGVVWDGESARSYVAPGLVVVQG